MIVFLSWGAFIHGRSRVATRRLFTLSTCARLLAGSLLGSSLAAQAQDWPKRQPIRVMVALTPGSAIDIVSRIVFEQLSKQIGQTIVIENRPGASQTLAAA